MTQIIPDIINIVIEAIFAILGLFFTGVAIPWLVKTGIPWLKDKRLYGIVTVLVKAAEIAATEEWINNYPRKIFGYKSSEVMFRECLREIGLIA